MPGLQEIYTAIVSLTQSWNKYTATFPRIGGNVTAINNLSTAAFTQIIGPNSNRNNITFINPSSGTVMVAPLTQGSSAGTLTPTATALGGSFPVLPSDFVTLSGICQQGWQAMPLAGGSGQPFTVMDQ